MNGPESLGTLAGVVLAAMFVSVAVRQRYPRAASEIETRAPRDLAPAEIATLLHGAIDTGDVVDTVIDLAIRGRLRIRELSGTGKPDWELTAVPPPYAPGRDVRPFEGAVVSGLFGRTDRIRLSELAARATVARVQRSLDDEADRSGWFRSDPKHARMIARLLGVVVVIAAVITALILLVTSSALVGIGIVAAALGLATIAWGWPRPSADGVRLRARIAAYRRFLGRGAFGDEHLPYALVLGHAGSWNPGHIADWYEQALPDPGLKRLRSALGSRFSKGPADRVSNGEGIERDTTFSGNI
jgi:uncharacterized protein (TIGR04222 family)